MKTMVIYRSKTGYTKRYAQWIAEELDADFFEASQAGADKMIAYDTVIYGGGLYAGGINGVKLIIKNLEKLEGRKLVVFATGASPPRKEAIQDVTDKNFTSKQLENMRFFYLRGGFDYRKLGLIDKLLMNLLKMKLKKKEDKTPDEKGMLAAYDTPVDFVKKQNIDELIAYVKA